jgi:MerR family transcriptional regulator, light-induced transcriptional regulator
MSISTTPTFNLKAVLKETGLAADTLRAWERRYGLPMPERTQGGHRLYSQHDIEIIKWLMGKQREGLSISHAVDMWNKLTASGMDPLPGSVSQAISVPSANLDGIRRSWLEACLDFDENTAEQTLNQAFALYPFETVCVEVLQRGLNEIGEMWYHAEATVQQEHFTSALAQRRLDALIAAAAPPTRPQTILIGGTANEQHTFAPLLFALLLRRRGLKVVYLGANVPMQRFNDTVQTVRPQLVILSAQQLQTANGLRETADGLQTSKTQIGYAGRIFNLLPELRKRIPAHFLGESIQEAIQSVETLLTSDTPLEEVEPITKQEMALSNSFLSSQPMIDLNTLTETIRIGIPLEFATIAIQQLGNNLASALSLGDLDSLRIEMDWIRGLLHEHDQQPESLGYFVSAYAQSVDSAMGAKGQSISDWLKSQIK